MTLIDLVKDFIVPLFLMILGASFSGAAVVAWWGVRRLVSGQDETNKTLKEMSQSLSATVTRVGQLETRVEIRDRVDDTRHRENVQSLRDIWGQLGKVRKQT